MTDRGDLSPEARALLGAARGGDEPRAEDRERVRARMIAALGAGAAGTAGGAATAGAARETATGIGAAGGGVAASGAVAAKLAAIVLGLAAVATGAFVALRAPAERPPAPQVATETPPPSPIPTPTLSPTPSPTPSPSPTPPPPPPVQPETPPKRKPARVARPAEPAAAPAPSANSLRAERALLARATTALRDADADAALAALGEHQRRFPRGVLVEERSATRVLALCAAGRTSEAARARDRFLAAWPRSVHAARVQGACVD